MKKHHSCEHRIFGFIALSEIIGKYSSCIDNHVLFFKTKFCLKHKDKLLDADRLHLDSTSSITGFVPFFFSDQWCEEAASLPRRVVIAVKTVSLICYDQCLQPLKVDQIDHQLPEDNTSIADETDMIAKPLAVVVENDNVDDRWWPAILPNQPSQSCSRCSLH